MSHRCRSRGGSAADPARTGSEAAVASKQLVDGGVHRRLERPPGAEALQLHHAALLVAPNAGMHTLAAVVALELAAVARARELSARNIRTRNN